MDESPDRQHRPGRVCRPALVDECRIGEDDLSLFDFDLVAAD